MLNYLPDIERKKERTLHKEIKLGKLFSYYSIRIRLVCFPLVKMVDIQNARRDVTPTARIVYRDWLIM